MIQKFIFYSSCPVLKRVYLNYMFNLAEAGHLSPFCANVPLALSKKSGVNNKICAWR